MDTSIITSVILGVFGLGITAYYSSHTKKNADEKMLKQLFTEFNERYPVLNYRLNEI